MTAEQSFVRSSLAPEVERREKALGRFTARFVRGLPYDLRSTSFCGPASFRDPEADNIWHPYMINGGISCFLKDQTPLLIGALMGGIRRFILKCFGRFMFVPNEQASVLGIAPTTICKPGNGGVETSYCHREDTDKMAWLLADDGERDPEGYRVSRFDILCVYFKMLLRWVTVSFSRHGRDSGIDWATGSLLTLRWILSLVWVNKWMLALKIREALKKMTPKKICCLHEMHPDSRIAWSEAKGKNIPGITIQHASIVRTKLWYFPTKAELAAGMATPDEMAVFSEEVQKLVKPFFPASTRYPLTCGPRFSQWKKTRTQRREEKYEDAPVLFAGSLPWWDNVVVLQGVQRLLAAPGRQRPIWVRLHPASKIPVQWKKWLDRMAEVGKVTISNGSLADALSHSAAVVGMNTTVLEEAALMGITVLVLESKDYLSFATPLGLHIPLEQFSWEILEESIASNTERREETIQEGRIVLGIDRPVFRVHAGDGKAGKPLQTLPEYT